METYDFGIGRKVTSTDRIPKPGQNRLNQVRVVSEQVVQPVSGVVARNAAQFAEIRSSQLVKQRRRTAIFA